MSLARPKRAEVKQYNVGAAKAHLSEIIDSVEQTGQEVVLMRRGRPVVRLLPVVRTVSIVGTGQHDPNINHDVVARDDWWRPLTDRATQEWYE